MPSQRRVAFRGVVQGVGFRATTVRLAADLPVAGSVRNLPDGSVELIVEGSDSAITTLLARIEDRFHDHLDSTESETRAAEGLTGPLRIRH